MAVKTLIPGPTFRVSDSVALSLFFFLKPLLYPYPVLGPSRSRISSLPLLTLSDFSSEPFYVEAH